VCSYTGAADSPGGCTPPGSTCVLAPTGASAGYGTTACVYRSDDPPPAACPAGYTRIGPITFYSGQSDDRDCAACACSGPPSAGSCAGTISLYGNAPDAGCTGMSDSYALGTTCQCYGQSQCGAGDLQVLNVAPGYVQAHYTVAPGTCAAPAQPRPVGGAAPTGPTTVCCM
jgi:hypothetical protein